MTAMEIPDEKPARRGSRAPAALLGVYLVLGFAVYEPAFRGGPIADDYGLLLSPFVTDLSLGRAGELLDPNSQATLSLRNYAPVRPLIQALQWRLFPENAPAYHATNVVLHALATWLLVCVWRQAGASLAAAALAGVWFAVHPANVEAVAWMSQVWGPVALCFGAGALLAQRRRPALSLVLFAFALLSRPTAVCLLPVALLREWAWRGEADASPRRWLWLAGWAVASIALAAVELRVFRDSGAAAQTLLHPDPLVRARTIVATAARYLVMAATGHGVSAFHEPRPALSWLDPNWLLGVAAALAIAARTLHGLLQRREEAAFWAWVVAAFLPVSQLFPFLYPMADRYLYFMLPGLLGAALLWGGELAERIADPVRRRRAGLAATGLVLVTVAGLALRSQQRAVLWTSEERVLADAATHYPDGVSSHLLRARRAAAQGDVEAAIAAIEVSRSRGWDYYRYLLAHPAFGPVRSTPRFQALLRELAAERIATAARRRRLTQLDLRDLAEAHRLRGEWREAAAALERALALGGPLDAELRVALASAKAQAARGSASEVPSWAPEHP